MNMKDIRRFRIVAGGPTAVAYDFDTETGELSVWLGRYVIDAPETAQRTAIEPGFKEWGMEATGSAAGLSLLEVDGLANVKVYDGLDLWAVRIGEVPEPLQEALNDFMIGQTRPTVDGADTQDFIWLLDYYSFLRHLNHIYQRQKGART